MGPLSPSTYGPGKIRRLVPASNPFPGHDPSFIEQPLPFAKVIGRDRANGKSGGLLWFAPKNGVGIEQERGICLVFRGKERLLFELADGRLCTMRTSVPEEDQ